jgi:single-strand DNA-binding protein
MRNINRIVLTGGLTRDPELRHTDSGTPVATLRLGYTTQRKQGGTWHDRSNYIDVEVWGARAESAHRHLHKGRQVAIDGRLEWREYETRGGERRQVHTVVADSVEYLANGQAARVHPDDAEVSTTAPVEPDLADDEIPF